jgi:hypothetical protein
VRGLAQARRARAVRARQGIARRGLAALAVAALLAAGAALAHEGDGAFADNGAGAPHSRYVLDLGPVDLGAPGKREYRFTRLPAAEFTVGLRLPASVRAGGRPPEASVRLALENEKGELVFHAEGRLADWLWSEAGEDWFVYQRGQQTYVAVAPRATRPKRVGERADGGWGTSFTPRTAGHYRLALEVTPARAGDHVAVARLHAVAGGWK